MPMHRYFGKRSHRLTSAEMAESERLRAAVERAGLTAAQVAAAVRGPVGMVEAWMRGHRPLVPAHQRLLRTAYSAETGGPG